MKNIETKQLLNEAKKLNELTGFAFVMAIADGKRRIIKEHEVLDEMKKPSKEFEAYQKEVEELNKKFSKKNDLGEPVIITKEFGTGQQYSYYDLEEDSLEERKKEFEKLQKKNKALLDEQKAKEEKYSEALREESTLKPKSISEKQLPKNINLEQIEIALKFLDVKKE